MNILVEEALLENFQEQRHFVGKMVIHRHLWNIKTLNYIRTPHYQSLNDSLATRHNKFTEGGYTSECCCRLKSSASCRVSRFCSILLLEAKLNLHDPPPR